MPTRRVLAGTLIVGVILGLTVGFTSSSLFGFPAAASDDATIPSESLVTSTGTGCSDGVNAGGWVGQQPIHDVMAVSFNYTFTHEATAIDVNTTLEPSANGDYFLRIETNRDRPASAKKGSTAEGCQPRTQLDASITVPRDYRSITVVLDDETVTTIENPESSMAQYRRINSTE